VIAAALIGLRILLFLGSWRSTVIIAISIPLAILTSVMVLSFLGQTINMNIYDLIRHLYFLLSVQPRKSVCYSASIPNLIAES
jgi:hypothetical protein